MTRQTTSLRGAYGALALRRALFFGALTTVAVVAHATQPPDPVNSDAAGNTAMGTSALYSITNGYQNTASGDEALESNTTGFKNTAAGYAALQNNVSGYDDAAFGSGALVLNTSGEEDTALGMDALYHNTTGYDNTAAGAYALYSNTTGEFNSAMGSNALQSNVEGEQNDATGAFALSSNTSGSGNTASGYSSLYQNTQGNDNTALGWEALYSNTTGEVNVGVGDEALYNNTSGSNNIGIGNGAGGLLTTGSFNIDIGNPGVNGDTNRIRIGVKGTQEETFIAGISTAKVTGAAVYVTSAGQLGVLASSERYKTAIAPMGGRTDQLTQLRPVTFHLKSDPDGAVQYGLIAEEVDKVYPELVIRDEKGVIQGVRYDELAPMLLNRVQQQQAIIAAQAEHVAAQDARIAAVDARADAMQRELADVLKDDLDMRAAVAQIQSQAQRLTMR